MSLAINYDLEDRVSDEGQM